jgi:hypothetical protein
MSSDSKHDPIFLGRRSRRRGLHRKAKHAARLAKKLSEEISAPQGSSGADVASLVKQIQPVLTSLRKSTLQENQPGAKLVASAIADLSLAFKQLARADHASSPSSTLRQLTEGKRALEAAATKARKAGDAWPL